MRPTVVFDMEVYVNYTLLVFMCVETKKVERFELPLSEEQRTRLRTIIKTHRLVTFNGIGYDWPLMTLILRGDDSAKIKKASDRIVIDNLKPWHFEREFSVKLNPPELDHVDLMEVAPLTGSLKLYSARLHCRSIQDLPIAPSKIVTEEEKVILRTYCENDCDNTITLYHALKEQLALREQMSATYGMDLRSKSDAQVAEAVIKKEVEARTHTRLDRPGADPGTRFHYKIPAWMAFETNKELLNEIRDAWFVIGDGGKVLMPEVLEKKDIVIAGKNYRCGIGGLHSMEKKQTVMADSEHVVIDWDVASFYPAIILNQGLYPRHIGSTFLQVYRDLIDRRLAAKGRAAELKKEIAKVKQMVYNLENAQEEPNISPSA